MNAIDHEIETSLNDLRAFMPQLIEASEALGEYFYSTINEDTWSLFRNYFQGLDDLYKFAQTVNGMFSDDLKDVHFKRVFKNFIEDLSKLFGVLNQYIDEELFVHAGDCIHYELTPLFKQFNTMLGESMDIKHNRFQRNLEYLKNKHPLVYKVIESKQHHIERMPLSVALSGASNVVLSAKDDLVSYFYSKYDPILEAKRWVESVDTQVHDKANVLLYGFGLGYHLEQLNNKYPDLNVTLFEPEEDLFIAAMHEVDLEQLFSRMKLSDLVVGWNKGERDRMLVRFLSKVKGETAVISLPAYDRINIDKKSEFSADAKTGILNYSSAHVTFKVFGMQWVENRLYNMVHNLNSPSVNGLKDKLEGKTCVIVGAGPSLAEDIETLRKLKDHAIIIAAGSTIQSLKHFGIDPHLIVSMDGSMDNYYAFKNVDVRNIPFLYTPQVTHQILDRQSDNLFHFHMDLDLTTRYLMGVTKSDATFNPSHSVTGLAIQAAAYMGSKDIVFIGQDLSYSGDKLYAPGATHVSEELQDVLLKEATIQVENVQGKVNYCNHYLFVTLRDIEELLTRFPNIRFTNTSQTGAKIKHTEWRRLEEVLNSLQEDHIPANLMQEYIKEYSTPYNEKWKQETEARLRKLPILLVELEGQLKRIGQKITKLPTLSRSNPLKCLDVMVDIEDIWGKVVNGVPFLTIYTTVLKNQIAEFDRELPEFATESKVVPKAQKFRDVLGAMVNSMQEVLPRIKEIVDESIRRVDQAESAKLSNGDTILS